ncbi:unnamed protein product [Effrenium voratum]|uniref:Uncharacterized protein n=1 Tax=Effrenium voratum TaxID=2562239 RepID=A0AA36IV05_9DINO|nr:unnamed protein product [Effrenium voratum]CAJ1394017.1 unnamed protein product [Effrenium voratum]CAJ1429972.1 unnamed protein product [Effrenium voratum]
MVSIPPLPRGAWPELEGDARVRQSSSTRPKAQRPLPNLNVPAEAEEALWRSRCSIVGLIVVELLRISVVHVFPSPGGLEYTCQMLSSAANSIAALGATPVFAAQGLGVCVNRRCLGSLLTLILTSATCTWGALVIALFPGGVLQRLWEKELLDEGAPQVLAFAGVWNCLMLSSVSLQSALCVSAWGFYRTYRQLGLYPPGKGKVQPDVSPLEFVCEAEDVALLSDQCHGNWQSCGLTTVEGLESQAPAPTPAPAPRAEAQRRLHEDDVPFPSS